MGRIRSKYLGWAALIACSLFLLCRALHRQEGGTADLALWMLSDSRRLAEWAGAVAWAMAADFGYAVGVGVLAAIVIPRGPAWLRRGPLHLPALAAAGGLTAIAHLVQFGPSWGWAAAWGLTLPLLGCLFGTWMGTMWLGGRRARLWLLPKAALAVTAAALGAGLLAWLSLDAKPLPFAAAAATSAEKRRLVDLLRDKNPISLGEGRTETLCLTEHDLNVLLSWGLSLRAPESKARVALEHEAASLRLSLRVPLGKGRSRFLNLEASGSTGIDRGSLRLAVDRCWVGGVELPRRFLASFCRTAVARLGRDRCSKPFLDATREMVVGPGRVSVTYGPVSLPPDLRREILGATVAGRDVIAATRAQIDHLLAVVGRVPRTEVSFGLCLETAFTFARDRARGKDPIPENRAALFALGGLLGHPRIEDFLGLDFDADAAAARRCGLTRVTLHGRSDWTRHFFVSAALVIFSDEVMSGAAGLLKEELDADAGGSGFSFADLLADRAGVAFAVCATRDQASARALQDRLAGGFRVDDFFPPAADLPEGIPDAQLQSQYGGVGGELYRRWVEEIEHRVAACPAYR